MHSWCPTEASCPGKSCYSVHENEIHRQFKLKLGNNSHVPQVLWDWDWDLVEGVPRRRTVGIEGSDAVSCDYLVVRGVARRIFDHVELEGDIREKHAHTWARSRWRLLNSHLIVSLVEHNKCFKIMILKHFLSLSPPLENWTRCPLIYIYTAARCKDWLQCLDKGDHWENEREREMTRIKAIGRCLTFLQALISLLQITMLYQQDTRLSSV